MEMPRIITVQGTFIKSDGTPETGSLEFYSKVYVVESDGETAMVPSVTRGDLDPLGQVHIELPATDDPAWSPNNWTYTLVMRLSGDFSSKEVVIPYNSPGAILSVSQLVPTYPSGNVSGNYIPLSAKGAPNGVATLDVNGKIPSAQLPASSGGAPDWSEVLNKPTTFTPSAHTHAVLDVTGLQAILDAKQAAGSYAPLSHVHAVANVTGLQAALDGKQASGDYATNTALTSGLAGKQSAGDYATNSALTSGLAGKQDVGDYVTQDDLDTKQDVGDYATNTALALKAPLASPTFTGTVSGVTKSMVGLGNVDNTADTAKPVSSAQLTALNLKANIASPTFTGTVSGISKAMVGLANVDNTSDAAKPVSTATQTALDGKAATSHTHTIANVTGLQTALDGKQATGNYATVTDISDLDTRLDAVEDMTPVVLAWNGTAYVEAPAARIYIGPSDPGATPDGSVWINY
jgi:hypothetical protein